jgi:transcriptional regulator with XRE-family HTH domain
MGMSQADLAKALEVSQNTVSKLERNRTRIDTDKIQKQ